MNDAVERAKRRREILQEEIDKIDIFLSMYQRFEIGDIQLKVESTLPENGLTPAVIGRMGGQARAKNLTPEQRSNIARKAAEKRWRNKAEKN